MYFPYPIYNLFSLTRPECTRNTLPQRWHSIGPTSPGAVPALTSPRRPALLPLYAGDQMIRSLPAESWPPDLWSFIFIPLHSRHQIHVCPGPPHAVTTAIMTCKDTRQYLITLHVDTAFWLCFGRSQKAVYAYFTNKQILQSQNDHFTK